MLLLYINVSFQSPFEVLVLPVEGPYLSNNLGEESEIVAAEDPEQEQVLKRLVHQQQFDRDPVIMGLQEGLYFNRHMLTDMKSNISI